MTQDNRYTTDNVWKSMINASDKGDKERQEMMKPLPAPSTSYYPTQGQALADKIANLQTALADLQKYKDREDCLNNRAKEIKELMKTNPQYTEKTKMIADWILSQYPNLDNCPTVDLTTPFLFNIAYRIEILLDFEVPEEFK